LEKRELFFKNKKYTKCKGIQEKEIIEEYYSTMYSHFHSKYITTKESIIQCGECYYLKTSAQKMCYECSNLNQEIRKQITKKKYFFYFFYLNNIKKQY